MFGKGEYTYQRVIDDFPNAQFIGIITFNISQKKDSYLLNMLRQACLNGANATIITNIPKRFQSYYGTKHKKAAKDMIDLYKCRLNPDNYGMRLNPYFSFENHAKIVMTENIVYWGSSNYSDESKENLECGTISTDEDLIEFIKDTFFPDVIKKAVPYYKYNYAFDIANLDSFISVCQKAHDELFYAAFEPLSDYYTNFEEEWFYKTYDSDVTVEFLRDYVDYISQFDEALSLIKGIIDDYRGGTEFPDEVAALQKIYKKYRGVYKDFYSVISSLFKNIEKMAKYDSSVEACRKIENDYSMEAVDEDFDVYAKMVMNDVAAEYEELIRTSEGPIRNALHELEEMQTCVEQIRDQLLEMLETDSKIDNTHI